MSEGLVADARSPLARRLGLLRQALVYEFRKASAFRTGFIVRELLRGVARPVVMIFVYRAMFSVDGLSELRGYSLDQLVQYLILVATFEKVIFHLRALDLSDQIFQGYVTKYLVMPCSYFTLALGRFAQFLAVQLVFAGVVWAAGLLLLPDLWPRPVSALAALQALALLLLGSYCAFLTYFILNSLAFWLNVVWTLLVMAGFVMLFVAGSLIPVSVMPEVLRETFAWLFPYWTLSAPIELYLGRLGTPDFLRGLAVLAASGVLLELLRQHLWTRGTRRYTGSGM